MCSAALAGALVMSAARPARATSPAEDFVIILAIGFGGADLAMTGYDIGLAAAGEAPAHGWLVAETAIAAPQALFLNGLLPFAAINGGEPDTSVIIIPTAMVTTLAVHGTSGLVFSPQPAEHIGLSAAVATNATLTNAALTRAFSGELSSIPVAAIQVSATVPQIIVGTVKAATLAEERARWIGLTAWAGALFLHGVASLIWGDDQEGEPTMAPEPPPLPAPVSGMHPGLRSSMDLGRHRRADRFGSTPRMRFAPTMVSDGVIEAPGFGISGSF
jgi:hypothetical protein